jgi:hypothetical protein
MADEQMFKVGQWVKLRGSTSINRQRGKVVAIMRDGSVYVHWYRDPVVTLVLGVTLGLGTAPYKATSDLHKPSELEQLEMF